MAKVLIKGAGVWFLLALCAILNGGARDGIIAPLFGEQAALPLSGIFLSAIIFFVTLLLIPLLKTDNRNHYFVLGGLWVFMTVAFEFFFGHFAMGKPWLSIFSVFNIVEGNLMSLALLVSAISPYAAARKRGYI